MIARFFVFLSAIVLVFAQNNRPIVGILTQPTDDDLNQYGTSYIAASYVKFLESAGARVVPIFHNSTFTQLDKIFNSINGLLLPGGGADIVQTPLFYSAQYLYNKALSAYDSGDYFPILGHCMGFEILATITSKDFNILSPVDAENISMALNLTSEWQESRWFGSAPADIIDILTTQKVTINNHMQSVSPKGFSSNQYLPSFYRVIATNEDRKGTEFISNWEGIKYPVYGSQWHAEKPQFEWKWNEDINHSADSIHAMQYFANWIVNESRKSYHKFSSLKEETAALIYNYSPIFTGADPDASSFTQVYVF